MFKNIHFYKIGPGFTFDLGAAQSAFAPLEYTECGVSQEQSIGWIPPRGDGNGALIESCGKHWIAKLMIEKKMLPASVIADEVRKRTAELEAKTGRKPGKKETKEITDDVRLQLLAKAFTKKCASLVWLNKDAEMLVIESSTQTKADEIVTQLVKTLEGLQITAIQTQQAPEAAMSLWLVSQEMPPKFTADRDCTLKSHDEFKASIRYEHHALDIVEIQEHIRAGKRPIQLAMTWDSRVSFVLTSGGNLKKLEFLSATLTEQFVDDFDGNFTIATAEISQLISALIETLGGAMAA
jgi:recombination associated protein RdgC